MKNRKIGNLEYWKVGKIKNWTFGKSEGRKIPRAVGFDRIKGKIQSN